jgi:hypothetical protein
MIDSAADPVVVSLKMEDPVFLEEYIKWICMFRESAYFEDLKEWIGTLSEDEYDEIASSASSFDSNFFKKCQFFLFRVTTQVSSIWYEIV